MYQLKVLIFIFISIMLANCSYIKSSEYTGPELSEQGYYEAAQADLDSSDFGAAISKLQKLESRYPFGRYAEQAQLDLIYAYYMHMEPEAAHATAERFIRLHPRHKDVDYAYYMQGLSSYSEGKGLVERYIALDYSKRDPGAAKRAFNEFSQLLARFPTSEYVPDARVRMVHLRNLLAKYEIHVANYYIKRQAFVAAANRGRYVIENYQETEAVPEALAVMYKAYSYLGLDDLAETSMNILKLNYPEHAVFDSNGQIPLDQQRNADRSWINIITFGLVG